ncbi:hypothetical protein Y032_0644g1082 [Ancylostoma ceylanicum]|uniref:Uncharacterized protein n=1 Tax=Ancylostoma ceylanicum TaxID=53326 RepID=A0A016WJ77_9BILA|nr:hypothetical protein Y032_0644g1082 [Ancylostoma ceylanicum]
MPPASQCIGRIRIQRLYNPQTNSNAWHIPHDGIDQRRPVYPSSTLEITHSIASVFAYPRMYLFDSRFSDPLQQIS